MSAFITLWSLLTLDLSTTLGNRAANPCVVRNKFPEEVSPRLEGQSSSICLGQGPGRGGEWDRSGAQCRARSQGAPEAPVTSYWMGQVGCLRGLEHAHTRGTGLCLHHRGGLWAGRRGLTPHALLYFSPQQWPDETAVVPISLEVSKARGLPAQHSQDTTQLNTPGPSSHPGCRASTTISSIISILEK